jgi:hypothetical protein
MFNLIGRLWKLFRELVNRNEKAVRFAVWIVLGVWAALATVVANWPRQTYVEINRVVVSPSQS